jgi:hypothetical protein
LRAGVGGKKTEKFKVSSGSILGAGTVYRYLKKN